jgi:anti-sigma factor RsiW
MRTSRIIPRLLGINVLTCRDVSELVTDYAEGTLPPRTRLAVRVHLFLCSMCRKYLDQMGKARNLLAGRPLDPPPAEVEERILGALRREGDAPAE